MKPAPTMATFVPGLSLSRIAVASRDRAQAEDPRQIDAGRGEAPLPRARRQDQMAVVDHAPVPRFDALGGPVDPRRARAAPELDPVLGEERFGPQRQAEHVHLAFEKGLR